MTNVRNELATALYTGNLEDSMREADMMLYRLIESNELKAGE